MHRAARYNVRFRETRKISPRSTRFLRNVTCHSCGMLTGQDHGQHTKFQSLIITEGNTSARLGHVHNPFCTRRTCAY